MGISQHVAGTAEFQIGLCDFGPIKRIVDDLKALLGGRARLGTGDEECPRIGATAPHTTTQLVQLGQAIPVSIENDYAAGLLDVHANFNHRGRDQNRSLAAGEVSHDLGFDIILVSTGQCGETDAGKLRELLQSICDFGYRVQRRADYRLTIVVESLIRIINANVIGRCAGCPRRSRPTGSPA